MNSAFGAIIKIRVLPAPLGLRLRPLDGFAGLGMASPASGWLRRHVLSSIAGRIFNMIYVPFEKPTSTKYPFVFLGRSMVPYIAHVQH